MSFEDERRAIEGRFGDNYSATPIKWEEHPFDVVEGTPYVALTILSGKGHQASLGGPNSALQRYAGVIQIDIFTPEDSGTKTAKQHADTIEAIFHHVQFSAGNSGTITTRLPWIHKMGVKDGWHRFVVNVDYHRDRTF